MLYKKPYLIINILPDRRKRQAPQRFICDENSDSSSVEDAGPIKRGMLRHVNFIRALYDVHGWLLQFCLLFWQEN